MGKSPRGSFGPSRGKTNNKKKNNKSRHNRREGVKRKLKEYDVCLIFVERNIIILNI